MWRVSTYFANCTFILIKILFLELISLNDMLQQVFYSLCSVSRVVPKTSPSATHCGHGRLSRSLFLLRSLDRSLLLRSFAFAYLSSSQQLHRVSIRGNPFLTMSRPPSAAGSAPGTPTPRTAASGGTTPIHTIVQNLPNLFQMYEKGTLSDTQVTQVRSIWTACNA